MSTSGISNSLPYEQQNIVNQNQQFQQEFQQLGKDLQSGNLSAAQQDFVTLQAQAQQGTTATPLPGSSPLVQDFSQLAQDLKSGNLSAAQQDYTKIQQDAQSPAQVHHHRHHHGGGGESNSVSQLFNQLGQQLQSGDLTDAQQTFASLQQDLPQLAVGATSDAASSQPSVNGISVSA